MKTKKYKVIRNGEKIEMNYDDICNTLGFIPYVNFVYVTTRGTISFTLGTPNEIRSLLAEVKDNGFKPSKSLVNAAK